MIIIYDIMIKPLINVENILYVGYSQVYYKNTQRDISFFAVIIMLK